MEDFGPKKDAEMRADRALVNSVSSGIHANRHSLLESLVFIALRRVTPEVFYYKTKAGRGFGVHHT